MDPVSMWPVTRKASETRGNPFVAGLVEQDTRQDLDRGLEGTTRRPPVTTATAPSATPLTAVDRCDRCGAQAYLRVQLRAGGELLFCAHHAREHGDKLREVAEYFHDETDKLGDRPAVAPDDER
jgi:hypothetical protein